MLLRLAVAGAATGAEHITGADCVNIYLAR